MKLTKEFSPLLFLAALGAGGISVAGFAFLNYTIPHGPGLIHIGQTYQDATLAQTVLYRAVEAGMIVFALVHFVLTAVLIRHLVTWLRSDGYREFIRNPLVNSNMLAPYISGIMSLNVMLASVRYFFPPLAENLQALMPWGMGAWVVLWLALMYIEIKLLSIAFSSSFDISRIHFGWLLHPFALGMATVTGTGVAALAHDPGLAHGAAFLAAISGTMGLFLLAVKLNALFKSHFAAKGLPETQFLPSLLIVVPNITLYAISLFRFGHYLEHHHNAELGPYFAIVILTAFAFETWYLAFGLSLIGNYLRNHIGRSFQISQWGLICPLVAYSVLGSFLHKVFIPNPVLYIAILAVMLLSAVLFFTLLAFQIRCASKRREQVEEARQGFEQTGACPASI